MKILSYKIFVLLPLEPFWDNKYKNGFFRFSDNGDSFLIWYWLNQHGKEGGQLEQLNPDSPNSTKWRQISLIVRSTKQRN